VKRSKEQDENHFLSGDVRENGNGLFSDVSSSSGRATGIPLIEEELTVMQ